MTPTVLITGATRGIGAATAARMAADGWNVALFDIDEGVRETAVALAGSCRGYVGDVSDEADWARVVAEVHKDLGPVDALVSNALVTDPTPIDRMELSSWQRQIDVNLTGSFHAMRACLPDLVRERDGRVGDRLVGARRVRAARRAGIRGDEGGAHRPHPSARRAVRRTGARELRRARSDPYGAVGPTER